MRRGVERYDQRQGLSHVDQRPNPQFCGGDIEETNEGQGSLVVAGRDGAHLPTDTRGKPRVNNSRVKRYHSNYAVQRAVKGCALPAHGPRKMLYNQFQPWATKDVWASLFQTLAQSTWTTCRTSDQQFCREGLSLRLQRTKEE